MYSVCTQLCTWTKQSLFDTMTDIIHKFNITYHGHKFHIQYTKLTNGKFAKTYIKNDEIVTDYITYEEYSSALAHIMLRTNPDEHNYPT
jgi:hypothetical protein